MDPRRGFSLYIGNSIFVDRVRGPNKTLNKNNIHIVFFYSCLTWQHMTWQVVGLNCWPLNKQKEIVALEGHGMKKGRTSTTLIVQSQKKGGQFKLLMSGSSISRYSHKLDVEDYEDFCRVTIILILSFMNHDLSWSAGSQLPQPVYGLGFRGQ